MAEPSKPGQGTAPASEGTSESRPLGQRTLLDLILGRERERDRLEAEREERDAEQERLAAELAAKLAAEESERKLAARKFVVKWGSVTLIALALLAATSLAIWKGQDFSGSWAGLGITVGKPASEKAEKAD